MSFNNIRHKRNSGVGFSAARAQGAARMRADLTIPAADEPVAPPVFALAAPQLTCATGPRNVK